MYYQSISPPHSLSLVAMSSWFTIKKIADDIFCITEPYFCEHANSYLIRGTPYDLLVDCGLGVSDIKAFLSQRGFKPRVVLTHAHFDHSGGIRAFAPQEILVTARVLQNLKDSTRWGKEFLHARDFDAAATKRILGATPAQVGHQYRVVIPKGVRAMKSQQIAVGKYHFSVLPMPGHTDDSVVLYEKERGLLITGDVLYAGKIYAWLPNSDTNRFLASLEQLKWLRFTNVLPGHNKLLNSNQALKVIRQWDKALKKM